ncbi:type I polyketide synthase [Oleiphilus messinensis]|nr:type I polyketide synthase [Oleiphilus messinensis]
MATSGTQEPRNQASDNGQDIAVIAIACRFPGANSPAAFWENLSSGIESVEALSNLELDEAGISEAEYSHPDYVRRTARLKNIYAFDHNLFRFTGKEAKTLDPQHRLLLECAWEAMEASGLAPGQSDTLPKTGIFAGCGLGNYFHKRVLPVTDTRNTADLYQAVLLNDKDFLASRIAYKLGLTGPAVAVQTACSTSLVAVHTACQSLLSGDCDLALAGGVSLQIPQETGFRFQSGMILSPNGRCAPFDKSANGTVIGSGAGIVVLKRLEDALEDGDDIQAVIKSTAINNDGADKMGFTAPSVQGQTDVILDAQELAGIQPEDISYIETHGTGTALGDPIEIKALNQCFAGVSEKCYIGSVKANIGHLDAASGIAGLIKTILCLKHKALPPTLHYTEANPEIPFAQGPFEVVSRLRNWDVEGQAARIAAVSSFGMGGTNAHAILQEAPSALDSETLSNPAKDAEFKTKSSHAPALLQISAATQDACLHYARDLLHFIERQPKLSIHDIANSLRRKAPLPFRATLIAHTREDALSQLSQLNPDHIEKVTESPLSIRFLFPGQGCQTLAMGTMLYANCQTFRETVDQCLKILPHHVSQFLNNLLNKRNIESVSQNLDQTEFTQPALFVVEYALAMQLSAWGVQPDALAGHSLGEYVAACFSEALTLRDALTLVSERARLMQSMPSGEMLLVALDEQSCKQLLQEAAQGASLDIAVLNHDRGTVLAGSAECIQQFECILTSRRISAKKLATSHAFHSRSMAGVLDAFSSLFDQVTIAEPQIALQANLTGNWHTTDSICDPQYWCMHLRNTVRFADNLASLDKSQPDSIPIYIEVGPGRGLSHCARRIVNNSAVVISSLGSNNPDNEINNLLLLLAKLWQMGYDIDWRAYEHDVSNANLTRPIALPPYPFEPHHHELKPVLDQRQNTINTDRTGHLDNKRLLERKPIDHWLYECDWQRGNRIVAKAGKTKLSSHSCVLLLAQQPSSAIVDALALSFEHVIVIATSTISIFGQDETDHFEVRFDPCTEIDQIYLLLQERGYNPAHVVLQSQHSENALPPVSLSILLARLDQLKTGITPTILVITECAFEVTGEENLGYETLDANPALLNGIIAGAPHNYPNLCVCQLDVESWDVIDSSVAANCFLNLLDKPSPRISALRGKFLWQPLWSQAAQIKSQPPVTASVSATQTGTKAQYCQVYLITGGFGKIALALTEQLIKTPGVCVLLAHRSKPSEDVSKQLRKLSSITFSPDTEVFDPDLHRVLTAEVDTCSLFGMKQLIERTVRRFGHINSIIHAAADMQRVLQRQYQSVQHLTNRATEVAELKADFDALFHSKVKGAEVIAEAIRNQPVHQVICMSSLASILGGYQLDMYAAVNSALDHYIAHLAKEHGAQWLSINWDAWDFPDTHSNFDKSSIATNAIRVPEGQALFQSILERPNTVQIAVSTQDLMARLSLNEKSGVKNTSSVHNTHGKENNNAHYEPIDQTEPRTEYALPSYQATSEEEVIVASIFNDVLAVSIKHGTEDFFNLGGDSLMATQVISRIREQTGITLSVAQFFKAPTIIALAKVLGDHKPQARIEIEI